jgi:hypothetical protein
LRPAPLCGGRPRNAPGFFTCPRLPFRGIITPWRKATMLMKIALFILGVFVFIIFLSVIIAIFFSHPSKAAKELETRRKKLKEDYEKALGVCNLMFKRNLVENDFMFYTIRGVLYSKLEKQDLALADYKEGILVCEEKLRKEPDDFQALSHRAILLLLSDGWDRGIREFNLLKDKHLSETNRKTIEMMLNRLDKGKTIEIFVEDLFFLTF